MSKKEGIVCLLIIALTPFAVSATWEFLPVWIATPSTLIGLIFWFAAASGISDNGGKP